MSNTTKSVCQLDDAGFYIGMAIADESPLEPGVFLIPGGCIDVAPPAGSDDSMFRWDAGAGGWLAVDKRSIVADLHKKAAAAVKGVAAVHVLLDAMAVNCGYSSILSAISYAEEPAVPAYQEDGRKFRAWRSLVWAWFYADPSREEMTLADLEEQAPKLGA